ncbi:MAG: SIMPL domain-containing protein [Lautropia sp.]
MGSTIRRIRSGRLQRLAPSASAALVTAAIAAVLALPHPAIAGPVVHLQTTARSELPTDEMVVELAVERAGPNVPPLNDEVLAALNRAIAKGNSVTGVKARLGSLTTQPEWGPQGKRTGWRVRGSLVLEGQDTQATAALAGELSTELQIANVAFRLTEAARTREQSRLLKEAAAQFGARAKETAAAFGFEGYELKTLVIDHAAPQQPPRPMAMELRAAAAAPASLPTEGGNATVTLTIGGSVELK